MPDKLDNLLNYKLNTTFSAAPENLWNKITVDLDHIEFDDTLKNKLNNNPKTAPDFLWTGIEQNLNQGSACTDSKIDEQLRIAYDKRAKAPEYIWYAIEQKLNIDRIWNNMSAELNKMKNFYHWRKRILRWSAVAILLLFLRNCDFGLNEYKQTSISVLSEKKEQVEKKQKVSDDFHNSASESLSKHKTINHYNSDAEGINIPVKPVFAETDTYKTFINSNISDSTGTEKLPSSIKFKPVSAQDEIIQDLSNLQIKNINKISEQEYILKNKIIEFENKKKELKINCDLGLITVLNQYVPLNTGTAKTNLRNYTIPVNSISPPSLSYGLQVGVEIGNNLSISTELYYRSTIGREYISNHNGNTSKYQVDFNYFRTNLVVNTVLLRYGNFKNNSIKAGVGFFFSNLQNYYVKGNTNTRSFINPEMNSWNAGLIASISQQHLFYNHFVLEYGLRTDAGFSLIFNQNNTKNYQNLSAVGTGFFASLKYKF